MITQHFRKRNYKQINLCEIGLFHIVLGEFKVFLKVPVIIIVRFGENNVPIYIAMYQFRCTWFILHFSFNIDKNEKITGT